jgi:hypothetical protein
VGQRRWGNDARVVKLHRVESGEELQPHLIVCHEQLIDSLKCIAKRLRTSHVQRGRALSRRVAWLEPVARWQQRVLVGCCAKEDRRATASGKLRGGCCSAREGRLLGAVAVLLRCCCPWLLCQRGPAVVAG